MPLYMPPLEVWPICSLMLFSMICYLFHHYLFVSASHFASVIKSGVKEISYKERIWDHYPIEGEIGL
jgi:hypothetical protein